MKEKTTIKNERVRISTWLDSSFEKNKLEELAGEYYVNYSQFLRALVMLVLQGEVKVDTKQILKNYRTKKRNK